MPFMPTKPNQFHISLYDMILNKSAVISEQFFVETRGKGETVSSQM